MAYVGNDQENQPGQTAPNPAAQPVTTSTGGGPAVSKTPTSNVSNQVAGTNAPAQPFQNISTYLSANAPQVGQEASTIAGGLNQQASDLGTATTNATGQFENQVNAATKNFTPDQAASFTANPAKFAENPSDVATFESLYNNVTPYTGPADFTSSQPYADLSTKAAGAANLGTSLKDFGGIQSYLQTLNPQSTAGTSALDTALLQGTPEAVAPINTAAATLAGTPANLAVTAAQEDALAQAAQQGTQASANLATTTGQNAQSTLQKAIQDRIKAVTASQTSPNSPFNAILAGLQTGQVPTEALATFGIDPAVYNAALKTGDLGAIVRSSPALMDIIQKTLPTGQNVATPQDVATAQAFQTLFGPQYLSPLTGS